MCLFGRVAMSVLAFVVPWPILNPAGLVSAQSPTAEPPAATQPAGDAQGAAVPPLVTDGATAVALEPWMAFAVIIALLVLALFVLWQLFRFLTSTWDRFYDTVREFARVGIFFAPVLVSSTARAETRTLDVGGQESAIPPTADTLRVDTPGVVATGRGGELKAFLNDAPAPNATWTLRDRDGAAVTDQSATLEPKLGPSATFTASKAGVYRVETTIANQPGLQVQNTITVIDPPSEIKDLPSLPFVGQGYGSIVGAIVLMAVVVALAGTRAIDADVVGVLLGSLAGYLFGVGISQGRT